MNLSSTIHVGGLIVKGDMRLVLFLLIFAAASFFSSKSSAQLVKMDLSYGLALGPGNAIDYSGNEASLWHFGFPVFVGARFFNHFSIGNNFEYRFINQYSDAGAEKQNFRGSYFSYFSPSVIFTYKWIRVVYEYKTQGTYSFANKDEQGHETNLKSPEGFRFEVSTPLFGGFIGLYREKLDFQKQENDFYGERDILGGQEIDHWGISFKMPVSGLTF